jgi:hypothetical protein
MSNSPMPMIQAYHPTTFLERGVSMPFTTPTLAGTRARPSERGGIELVLPNPSGGRGVYVLPWAGVRELCKPTVHDTCLQQKIATLRGVTPELIRQAAHEVAAEGLAGREALAAAGSLGETDRQDRTVINFLLLMAMVEQVQQAKPIQQVPDRNKLNELEARAKRTIADLAPQVGWPAETIAAGLEELAGLFMGVGVGAFAEQARIPRLLAQLCELRTETATWAQDYDDDSGAIAAMTTVAAGLTITCAQVTLADAHDMTKDVAGLIRDFGRAPELIGARIARSDWLLDGWEQICLLWRGAPEIAERRAVLHEIALLVPMIPKEATDWVDTQIDTEGQNRFRKTVTLNVDWRTGSTVFDRVGRNERLRAQCT